MHLYLTGGKVKGNEKEISEGKKKWEVSTRGKKRNVNMNMGMKGIWEYEQQAR